MKLPDQLQRAIDNLCIEDVYLRDSFATCTDDFNPKYSPELSSLIVQNLHTVRRFVVAELEDDGRMLQVFIRVGVRWVAPDDDSEEPRVFAIVEGEFIAEYSMQDQLEEECLNIFAEQNASFHVWPYWREFLSSQCDRLRLPRLVIPTVQFSKFQATATVEE